MSSTRLHPHSSLPAPVVHAGFSVSQSKSHVLAGVQDAYWSDDEADDAECPLCLEEMDISDLNFKPCICGYQVCRFCWHHIKENLNRRCPACRREYSDDAVQFKPLAKEDHKRLTQQKKQRERERKELDALGRRHLANVRVVQRNVVYVVGMGPRFAKEELISTLRSSEYFGQYGKISKILLVKRTPSSGGAPIVGIYITYHRREDAARCIAAVDGTSSPGSGRELMRASYGTTKYCMAFLRGASCSDHGCMNLHEWGDEKDCFTKEDLTTLKHTMKDTESRSRATTSGKKADDADGLPRTSAWGHKTSNSSALHNNTNHSASTSIPQRQTRRGGAAGRQARNSPASDSRLSGGRTQHDRKVSSIVGPTKSPSQASSSRPSTPAGGAKLPPKPAASADVKTLRQKELSQSPQPPRSPASSVAVESDLGSGSQDTTPLSPAMRPMSADLVPAVPPGIAAIPPGLPAPPGLPIPGRPPQLEATPSQTSYQMSTAAQALLDDVKARREAPLPSTYVCPFPDFDRTLQTLSGGNSEFGGFSFNLDPKLAGDDAAVADSLPDLEAEANTPFQGSFTDVFPALRPPAQHGSPSSPFMGPPGISFPPNTTRAMYDPLAARPVERQSTGGSNYIGSFNPFAETNDESSSRKPQYSPLDEDRKVSRFGFARGRQGSTAASSPLHASSPLSNSDNHTSFLNEPPTAAQSGSQWTLPGRQQQHLDHGYSQSSSQLNSPLAQHAQAQAAFSQHQSRFQPFDSGVSEAQLRELIQSSRERAGPITNDSSDQQTSLKFTATSSFNDPAIMAARFASPVLAPAIPEVLSAPVHNANIPSSQLVFGPPPGLAYPMGISASPALSNAHSHAHSSNMEASQTNGSTHVSTSASPAPSVALSASDFPALTAEPVSQPQQSTPSEGEVLAQDSETLAKAERKAAKKAAAAARAAERQKVAQEKAALKAAEKARVAQEKAAEKEKAAALKVEKERLLKEKAEKEKAEKERERAEKVAQAERERVAQVERERVAQAEKERDAQVKASTANQVNAASPIKVKQADIPRPHKTPRSASSLKQPSAPTTLETVVQAPILSKMPKKNKPVARPIRIPKEEENVTVDLSAVAATTVSDIPHSSVMRPSVTVESSVSNSRAQSLDRDSSSEPTSIAELLEEIDVQNPTMDLPNHPFFDQYKLNPTAKMPLEYGPLVHALSALSVGGGSFANNMPSGSIDNAVSSFQQLLETLTQTISDLLRLLPRTTWDDSSSFDGVLRDMLKGDDFLEDNGDDGTGKEDEVAALTLALERRARWMEVQLSKLEELHRDINTAAVRAVLSFNDNGWDRYGFMPRMGNTLRRFDTIGMMQGENGLRPMTADELETKLVVAKEAAMFAESEVREMMEKMAAIRPCEGEVEEDEM